MIFQEQTSKLRANHAQVRERIAAACAKAGRSPEDVRLVWVSKTHPQESILAALDAGAALFGENKAQEILAKFPLPTEKPHELHLIGHLQRNKVRKVLPVVSVIHSVDSSALLTSIERIAKELGLKRQVFLQINTTEEDSKSGFYPQELVDVLRRTGPLEHVECVGLMTMGPTSGDPKGAAKAFTRLRNLLAQARTALKDRSDLPLKWLSMGMSGDYEEAIAHGAHFIRVGTALFGERDYSRETGDSGTSG